ncbi:hypothetical protein [Methylobacterium oryzihabitans]|uniref:DUF1795 domain-containing protein n=1 Tax=Methylobacterium oryzihabitans TaxID=2499852 RepID=A0A437P8B8_9HYPH|nr:hypothetical protein [Methylobacterium oryzihabitans]RVU18479.1 hypothetical protein EOE48_11390 [Methylobacterium oryzihabitans]
MHATATCLCALLVALPCSAGAVEFQNSYLRFELPAGWTCELEKTEFVCNPPHVEGQPVGAIMVLAAKIPGPDDGLGTYRRHLETRGAELGRHGIVKAPSYTTIGDALWVDATLRGAEISGYLTRYLATVKHGLAILYTFSAHETVRSEVQGAALLAVSTLQVKDTWRRER